MWILVLGYTLATQNIKSMLFFFSMNDNFYFFFHVGSASCISLYWCFFEVCITCYKNKVITIIISSNSYMLYIVVSLLNDIFNTVYWYLYVMYMSIWFSKRHSCMIYTAWHISYLLYISFFCYCYYFFLPLMICFWFAFLLL